MKVVLAHDWLTGFRGGERVLEAIAEMFPDAPIYTLIHEVGSTSPLIEKRKIHTSFLNNLPNIEKNYRKYLPLFPTAVERMKIEEEADLLISSSHCVIKGLKKPKNAKHLCYIHSPMRYIYDQFDNYFGGNNSKIIQLAAHTLRPYLQTWDYLSNTNVDKFVANANFVRERVRFYYGTEASVVHPFVDLADFAHLIDNPSKKEDYYLMVTAFAPNKRVDLAIRAFNQLGLKLKIVGSGQCESELKGMAKNNIEFMGHQSRKQIIDLMSKAQAFIFPGVEDFGITPLESLASGTPVIAYAFGGVLETLNNEVAHFFFNPREEDLINALKGFKAENYAHKNLIARAHLFSKEAFKANLLKEITTL